MDDDPTKPIPAQDEQAPTAPTEPLAPGADPFGVTAAAAALPPEDAIGAGNPVVAPAPAPLAEPEPTPRRWWPWLIIGGAAAILAIAAIAFLPGLIDGRMATTPTPGATTPPPAEPADGGTDPAPPPAPAPPPPAPAPPPPEPTPEPTSPPPEPTPTPTP